jgi:hypothetical protein
MQSRRSLVERAHANGLWVRLNMLGGSPKTELSCRGWFRGNNFGWLEAVRVGWHADYLASDQYELQGNEIRKACKSGSGAALRAIQPSTLRRD